MIPYLHKGDTIGITATARKVSPEEMAPAVSFLENWGFKVVQSPHLYQQQNQFAGADAQRAAAFQQFLDDPEIKAVLFARGGYGTVRIVDQLDFTAFQKHPKWIAGFSDITVLHSHIHMHLQLPTLHSPMAINMQPHCADTESIEALRRILCGENMTYQVEATEFNRSGKVSGVLVGGNLSVLYSTIGSACDLDTDGKILFLEDLDEYLYHVDRMMMNMKRTGKLSKLKGLIVGGMGDMKDNLVPYGKNAYEIIQEHIAEYDYPVCFGFPAGHDKRNLPLIFGAEARLEVGDVVKLHF